MGTNINGYDGHFTGTSKYGKCVYNDHITRARAWLAMRLVGASPNPSDPCPVDERDVKTDFPLSYKGQPNPDDWTNPTKTENGKKVVVYPLKHLNSSFREWENHLCISSGDYRITNETNDLKFATANGMIRSPKIYISGYCAALAVIRAGIMHEVYEMRVGSKYAYYNLRFQGGSAPCHTNAGDREKKVTTFEDPSETMMRKSNTELCRYELEVICDKIKEQEGREDWFYRKCTAIAEEIRNTNHKYIPGYCEIYVRQAYQNPRQSQIGKFFEEAKRRRIRFSH
ncbi:MAG: hypothetical protein E3J71_04680 [Candidatus Stahlbacteria bacterium]|nr:MAG: hypothetical protein E3J71_04680 [Candidatus Stahlbacteria bacterium]